MVYTPPAGPWEDLPSTDTPVESPWLTQVDATLTSLDGASGRVPAIEADPLVAAAKDFTGAAVGRDYALRLVDDSPLSFELADSATTSRQTYGRSAGRRYQCRLGGRTAAHANVATPLAAGTAAQVPLAEVLDCTGGPYPTGTGGIAIPADAYPGRYLIRYKVHFGPGGQSTNGVRRVELRRNGSTIRQHNEMISGASTAYTLQGEAESWLYAGQEITLWAYATGAGAGALTVTAEGIFDVYLEVERIARDAVIPMLVGSGHSEEIEGITRGIWGHFLNCTSWASITAPLGTGTAFDTWVASHRDRAADIAGPLIPHKGPGVVVADELAAVAAGAHDAELTTLGAALATYGPDTVYFRPWWEMHIPTWHDDPGNDFTGAEFVAAWDHAIPVVRAAFAAAARPGQTLHIVFCCGGEVSSSPPDAYIPAPANVDVFSIDTYLKRFGTTVPTEDQLVVNVREDVALVARLAAKYGKQVAISEWSNWARHDDDLVTPMSHGLGDYPGGVDLMFDLFEASGVIYACWHNYSGVGDSGLDQSMADLPLSRARYLDRASRMVRYVTDLT